MVSSKVRLAVVGGGFGATHHWHEHPHCEVTAVADGVEERRAKLSEQYHCDNACSSLDEMLEKFGNTFDAVAVFTDAPSHPKHAIQCMEAGKHVVSACPAGMDLDSIRQLIATKEKTGLLYMMHESSYYQQSCIAARELYQAGEFGRILFSEVEYYHPGLGGHNNCMTRWQKLDSWRYGVPPLLYPTHALGLLVGVTGERIIRVSAIGQRVGEDFPEPGSNRYNNPFNNEYAIGMTNQGNVCRFAVCWEIAAHGERGQWLGSELTCAMENSFGQPDTRRKVEGDWEKWEVPEYWKTDRLPESMRHDSGHGGSATFLCAEFIESILEEREPSCSIYEAAAMTVPGIIAHESALLGGVQLEVPDFDKAT